MGFYFLGAFVIIKLKIISGASRQQSEDMK